MIVIIIMDIYDKLQNKSLKISETKIKISELIEYCNESFNENTILIIKLVSEHKEFLHFTETMKLYQLYVWEYLKYYYNKLKNNMLTNQSKLKQIIKLYGQVISYYDEIDVEIINKTIQDFSNKKEIENLEFSVLQKIHNDVMIKCKTFSKSNKYYKLKENGDKYKDILLKFYGLYLDKKILLKKYYFYKSLKCELINSDLINI